jgi:hypothetical protein
VIGIFTGSRELLNGAEEHVRIGWCYNDRHQGSCRTANARTKGAGATTSEPAEAHEYYKSSIWHHEGQTVLLHVLFAGDVPVRVTVLGCNVLTLGWLGRRGINGQTQAQKFSLYRHREGKSDLVARKRGDDPCQLLKKSPLR